MCVDPVEELLHDPRSKGQPITWEATQEKYDAIRRAGLTHVAAEEVLFAPFTEEIFNAKMDVMLSVNWRAKNALIQEYRNCASGW